MADDLVDTLRRALPTAAGITGRTRLRTLVRDSLDAIELLALISERYGVGIEPEDLPELKTVADLAAYVEQHRRPSSRSTPRW